MIFRTKPLCHCVVNGEVYLDRGSIGCHYFKQPCARGESESSGAKVNVQWRPQVTRSLEHPPTLDGMLVHRRLLLSVFVRFVPTIYYYPFILLDRESH